MVNNHTILGSNLLNLNKGGKVPIYYKKYFLYSLLYGGSIVSEYFNEIKTLKYDNHSSILKAHAMFYALEPTEDDWILFYKDGTLVNGEYPVTCTIDDRGNSLPPYSTKAGERYISFEPNEDEKSKYIELTEIKDKILKEIVSYEFEDDKITIDNLSKIKLKKYSLATLKSILEMLSQNKGLDAGDTIKYTNKEMVEEELSRRILLMKKDHLKII
jgi:DNA-binding MarR family transcriptional regulator